MEVKKNNFYYLVNRDVVRILSVRNEPWGIGAIYITGKNKGRGEFWDDSKYPHLVSFDVDDRKYAITNEEVSKEEYPEYYL